MNKHSTLLPSYQVILGIHLFKKKHFIEIEKVFSLDGIFVPQLKSGLSVLYKAAKRSGRISVLIRNIIKNSDNNLKVLSGPCGLVSFGPCDPGKITDNILDSAKDILANPKSRDMFLDAAKPFKNSKFSKSGRTVTKHPGIVGKTKDNLRQTYKTEAEINKAAMDAVTDIMNKPKTVTKDMPRYGKVTEYRRADGWGVRYQDSTGEFIGFIEPPRD